MNAVTPRTWPFRATLIPAAIVLAALAASGCSGSAKPQAASTATASAPTPTPTFSRTAAQVREVAALGQWDHSAGNKKFTQTQRDETAFGIVVTGTDTAKITAAAIKLYKDAGLTLPTPPPVAQAQWTAALKDWQHAALLAGGDPGVSPAPSAKNNAKAEKYLEDGNKEMIAAGAAVGALNK